VDLRELVRVARVGRLATVAADGRPHLVPVCFALVGDTVYSAVDHKPKRGGRLKRLDNIRATGRVSLLVDRYDEDWSALWWVRLDGTAEVLDGPAAAFRALVDKYPQYARQPPTGPIVAITVTRWSGWTARG
jgi:PPOX class probable F420-dependent enzyme